MPPVTPSASWPTVWTGDGAVLVIARMSARGRLRWEEAQLAQRMAPDRRREFSLGRIAAREALRISGAPDVAIPMGVAGEPRWPANWGGSISHTQTHAAALVAPLSRYRAVGVDLDDGRSLGDEAAADLMSSEEVQRVISAGIASDKDGAQRFIFSAKEAVFKCQYPLTEEADLEFSDVELAVGRNAGDPSRLNVLWRTHLRRRAKPRIEVFPVFLQQLTIVAAVALHEDGSCDV